MSEQEDQFINLSLQTTFIIGSDCFIRVYWSSFLALTIVILQFLTKISKAASVYNTTIVYY